MRRGTFPYLDTGVRECRMARLASWSSMSAAPPPLAVFLGGPAVAYEEWAPPPDLAPWVAAFWRVRASAAHRLRVLPDGCVDLIGDDVVGPFSAAVLASMHPGDSATGIRLRPGAFPALFGVPASELRDRRLPLAEVAVRRPLRVLARDAAPPDPLAAAALRGGGDVGDLARASGYSERQLRRRLHAATGLGPKRLARIGRMQALLHAGRGESWARAAVDHGYYDEAHMANDVRALAGATPHALLHGRSLQDAEREAA
jgi:AraC-like DNA-binding protein